MTRARRVKPDRPLPTLRFQLPTGVDPYTCHVDAEYGRTWSQEDLYWEVVRDAEWSVAIHRPKTSVECPPGDYCPFVGCQYHLYLDVSPDTGMITFNHPTLNVWELEACCVLKLIEKKSLAPEDGYTLEEIAPLIGLTRERVRQIEAEWMARVRRLARSGEIGSGYLDMHEVSDD